MISLAHLFSSSVPPVIVLRNKRIRSTTWIHTKDVQTTTLRSGPDKANTTRQSVTIDIGFNNGEKKSFSGGRVICNLAKLLNPLYSLEEVYEDCDDFEDDWEIITRTETIELRNEQYRTERDKNKPKLTSEEMVEQLEEDGGSEPPPKKAKSNRKD